MFGYDLGVLGELFHVRAVTFAEYSPGGVLTLASFENVFKLDATWQGLMSGKLISLWVKSLDNQAEDNFKSDI